MDNSKAINVRNSSAILSAGGGNIKDTGGPSKYIGAETNNSIWDNSIIDKLIATPDNGEKLKQNKENMDKVRKGMKQSSLDGYAESLSQTDTRKDSTVTNVGEFLGSSYRSPVGNMSMFDKEAFERLPEKSAGEQLSEDIEKSRVKEDTHKRDYGTRKTSDLLNSLFENIIKEKEIK
jgi:hypothetical protein